MVNKIIYTEVKPTTEKPEASQKKEIDEAIREIHQYVQEIELKRAEMKMLLKTLLLACGVKIDEKFLTDIPNIKQFIRCLFLQSAQKCHTAQKKPQPAVIEIAPEDITIVEIIPEKSPEEKGREEARMKKSCLTLTESLTTEKTLKEIAESINYIRGQFVKGKLDFTSLLEKALLKRLLVELEKCPEGENKLRDIPFNSILGNILEYYDYKLNLENFRQKNGQVNAEYKKTIQFMLKKIEKKENENGNIPKYKRKSL